MLPPVNALGTALSPLSSAAIPARVASQGVRVPAVEPGQDARAPTTGDTADDRRRTPPPPRIEANPAERALRGDRADAADPRLSRLKGSPGRSNPFLGSAEAFRDPIFARPIGAFETAAERGGGDQARPRPSSAFLAQIIGQDVASQFGAVGRNTESTAQLYRRTEAVTERERLRTENASIVGRSTGG